MDSVGRRRSSVLAAAGAAVICVSVVSVAVRTGTTTWSRLEQLSILGLCATPSLVIVAATSRWRIGAPECALGLLGWAPLAFRDLSCTDCGFAILLPLNLLLAQGSLVLLALLRPSSEGVVRRG